MKPKTQFGRSLVAASALLPSLPLAHGAVIESFESGTLNGWGAGTLNGSTTTVGSALASNGTFSAGCSLTVPASFSGWTVNTILERDPRSFMDAGTTTLTMDVYSDWSNPNGWGVYGNTIMLVLSNSNGWSAIAPTSGSLVNGAFATLTWDMTPHAAAITDSGLGWSSLGIAWHVGTWAGGGDGLPNGTQTFAIDNITAVPEPSSLVLLAGGLLSLRRRRR
jgi:hypothetical protein